MLPEPISESANDSAALDDPWAERGEPGRDVLAR